MIVIRQANVQDIPHLLVHMRAFAQFFGTNIMLYPSDEIATARLHEMISGHVFLVAVEDGCDVPIVGFIAGLLSKHFFNPDIIVLTEMLWWVTPHYRNGRAGLRLLNEFVEIGKKTADWIIMSLEEKSPVNPATLEKRGFKVMEHSYLMEV